MSARKEALMVVGAAEAFPRTAEGHGSRRKGMCNVPGCRMGEGHFQDRVKLAKRWLEKSLPQAAPNGHQLNLESLREAIRKAYLQTEPAY